MITPSYNALKYNELAFRWEDRKRCLFKEFEINTFKKNLQFWDTLKEGAIAASKGLIGQEELERRGLTDEEIKAREESVRTVIRIPT